jgi:hypothetical protein
MRAPSTLASSNTRSGSDVVQDDESCTSSTERLTLVAPTSASLSFGSPAHDCDRHSANSRPSSARTVSRNRKGRPRGGRTWWFLSPAKGVKVAATTGSLWVGDSVLTSCCLPLIPCGGRGFLRRRCRSFRWQQLQGGGEAAQAGYAEEVARVAIAGQGMIDERGGGCGFVDLPWWGMQLRAALAWWQHISITVGAVGGA